VLPQIRSCCVPLPRPNWPPDFSQLIGNLGRCFGF
jgi:hypothetical protein